MAASTNAPGILSCMCTGLYCCSSLQFWTVSGPSDRLTSCKVAYHGRPHAGRLLGILAVLLPTFIDTVQNKVICFQPRRQVSQHMQCNRAINAAVYHSKIPLMPQLALMLDMCSTFVSFLLRHVWCSYDTASLQIGLIAKCHRAGDLDPISMKPLATDHVLQPITNTGSPRALPERQKLSSGRHFTDSLLSSHHLSTH